MGAHYNVVLPFGFSLYSNHKWLFKVNSKIWIDKFKDDFKLHNIEADGWINARVDFELVQKEFISLCVCFWKELFLYNKKLFCEFKDFDELEKKLQKIGDIPFEYPPQLFLKKFNNKSVLKLQGSFIDFFDCYPNKDYPFYENKFFNIKNKISSIITIISLFSSCNKVGEYSKRSYYDENDNYHENIYDEGKILEEFLKVFKEKYKETFKLAKHLMLIGSWMIRPFIW